MAICVPVVNASEASMAVLIQKPMHQGHWRRFSTVCRNGPGGCATCPWERRLRSRRDRAMRGKAHIRIGSETVSATTSLVRRDAAVDITRNNRRTTTPILSYLDKGRPDVGPVFVLG